VRLRADAGPELLADLRALLGPNAARVVIIQPTVLTRPVTYELVSAD